MMFAAASRFGRVLAASTYFLLKEEPDPSLRE
jgi:hypothetical protein